MSRYDIEKFEPPPDPDLVCCICQCVLDRAVECPCRHVFCQSCIERWLTNRHTCPTCRKKTKKQDLKPVLPLVQNMLNRLLMVCDYRDNGCLEKIMLEHFDRHIKNCGYEKRTCRFSKCGISILRMHLENHETVECEHRELQCKGECGLMIPQSDQPTHNCVAALKAHIDEKNRMIEQLKEKLHELNTLSQSLNDQLLELRQQLNDRNLDISSISSGEESDFTEFLSDELSSDPWYDSMASNASADTGDNQVANDSTNQDGNNRNASEGSDVVEQVERTVVNSLFELSSRLERVRNQMRAVLNSQLVQDQNNLNDEIIPATALAAIRGSGIPPINPTNAENNNSQNNQNNNINFNQNGPAANTSSCETQSSNIWNNASVPRTGNTFARNEISNNLEDFQNFDIHDETTGGSHADGSDVSDLNWISDSDSPRHPYIVSPTPSLDRENARDSFTSDVDQRRRYSLEHVIVSTPPHSPSDTTGSFSSIPSTSSVPASPHSTTNNSPDHNSRDDSDSDAERGCLASSVSSRHSASLTKTKLQYNSNDLQGVSSNSDGDTLGRSLLGSSPHSDGDTLGRSLLGSSPQSDGDTLGRSLLGSSPHSDADTLGRSLLGNSSDSDAKTLGRSLLGNSSDSDADTLGKSLLGNSSDSDADTLGRSLLSNSSDSEADTLGRSLLGNSSHSDADTLGRSLLSSSSPSDSDTLGRSLLSSRASPLSVSSVRSELVSAVNNSEDASSDRYKCSLGKSLLSIDSSPRSMSSNPARPQVKADISHTGSDSDSDRCFPVRSLLSNNSSPCSTSSILNRPLSTTKNAQDDKSEIESYRELLGRSLLSSNSIHHPLSTDNTSPRNNTNNSPPKISVADTDADTQGASLLSNCSSHVHSEKSFSDFVHTLPGSSTPLHNQHSPWSLDQTPSDRSFTGFSDSAEEVSSPDSSPVLHKSSSAHRKAARLTHISGTDSHRAADFSGRTVSQSSTPAEIALQDGNCRDIDQLGPAHSRSPASSTVDKAQKIEFSSQLHASSDKNSNVCNNLHDAAGKNLASHPGIGNLDSDGVVSAVKVLSQNTKSNSEAADVNNTSLSDGAKYENRPDKTNQNETKETRNIFQSFYNSRTLPEAREDCKVRDSHVFRCEPDSTQNLSAPYEEEHNNGESIHSDVDSQTRERKADRQVVNHMESDSDDSDDSESLKYITKRLRTRRNSRSKGTSSWTVTDIPENTENGTRRLASASVDSGIFTETNSTYRVEKTNKVNDRKRRLDHDQFTDNYDFKRQKCGSSAHYTRYESAAKYDKLTSTAHSPAARYNFRRRYFDVLSSVGNSRQSNLSDEAVSRTCGTENESRSRIQGTACDRSCSEEFVQQRLSNPSADKAADCSANSGQSLNVKIDLSLINYTSGNKNELNSTRAPATVVCSTSAAPMSYTSSNRRDSGLLNTKQCHENSTKCGTGMMRTQESTRRNIYRQHTLRSHRHEAQGSVRGTVRNGSNSSQGRAHSSTKSDHSSETHDSTGTTPDNDDSSSTDNTWEPGTDCDDMDDTISEDEDFDTDSSYEVLVPKSTAALLEEYAADDSDESWTVGMD